MIEIIAHRGASKDRLENSRAAFELALEQGCDGIELDVHATEDGVVVVHHDAQLASSHDGSTVSIATSRWADLEMLRLSNGERIPTLDETLEMTAGRAIAYIEVKGSGIERQVADCLWRHEQARAAVHSFDHRIPLRVRALRPSLPIGLLSASYPVDMAGFIGTASADSLWQQSSLIDEALVGDVMRLGSRVIAWTENDAGRSAELMRMGVYGICTDTPARLRTALERLVSG